MLVNLSAVCFVPPVFRFGIGLEEWQSCSFTSSTTCDLFSELLGGDRVQGESAKRNAFVCWSSLMVVSVLRPPRQLLSFSGSLSDGFCLKYRHLMISKVTQALEKYKFVPCGASPALKVQKLFRETATGGNQAGGAELYNLSSSFYSQAIANRRSTYWWSSDIVAVVNLNSWWFHVILLFRDRVALAAARSDSGASCVFQMLTYREMLNDPSNY